MLNRYSIKFKLFILLSVAILSFISVFAFFWFYNTNNTKHQIEAFNQTIFKEYMQKNEAYQKEASEKNLEEYFSLVSQVLASDAYELDYDAIQSKIGNFLDHNGLCTLEIRDVLSHSNMASAMRNCISQDILYKEIPVVFKNERIALLTIGYSLEHIHSKIRQENHQLNEKSEVLQQKIDESFSKHFYLQALIFFLMAFGMLLYMWYQIDTTVVKPIEKLLYQMQNIEFKKNQNEDDHTQAFKQTEIGQLSNYFHQHIGKLVSQLHQRVNYDSVTHLYSKQKFLDDVDHANVHTLAIIDLGNFKEANNFFGADVGDKILNYTAKHLLHFFDEPYFKLYRLHSDEFAIIVTNGCSLEFFIEKLNTFANDFSNQQFNHDGTLLSFTVAIGVTSKKSSPVKSMTCASIALKQAKNSQETIVTYHEHIPIIKEYENNIHMVNIIKEAIKRQDVIPYFQPIYSHAHSKITKYEALMRINHKGVIVPPLDFLDIAKKSNTYKQLSEHMVMKVISFLKKNNDKSIAINFSVNDIMNKRFCSWLLALIAESQLAHRITFEITEQEGIQNFDVIKDFIAEAKKIGIKIAIDDFGSGYSNFEHLIHLDVNYLKIDGSLIRNIDTDKNAQLIVQTIVNFAKSLHIETIAEYVSSEEIFNYVRNLGIDYSQGYYIGHPKATF